MSDEGYDHCIDENGEAYPPNMELIAWQRWMLLTGCCLSAL
jgi:hypothetical protein